MPARDADYMSNERRRIANAALEVALERGLAKTSLRDICRTADVSMGGFYTHFKTKHDAVLASFYLLNEQASQPNIESWQEVVTFFRETLTEIRTSELRWRQLRLFYEYLTSTLLDPPDSTSRYEGFARSLAWWKDLLERLFERGELTLPLGLDTSARACLQLFTGLAHILVAEPRVDLDEAVGESIVAVEHLLGRVAAQARRS